MGKAFLAGLALSAALAAVLITAGGSSAEEAPSKPQSGNGVVEPTFIPLPSGQTT